MENSESIDNEHHECTICLQSYLSDQGVLKCKHSFCYTCIEDWSKQENTCPLCKVRFVYIERISKDEGEEHAVVGGKRKAKPKKNKRTTVKKKSQSDVKPYSRGTMNAQDAYMHHMLQTYIAQQMRFQHHEEEEEEEEESDDDSNPNDYFRYAMMNRHGLAMSGRRPGLFGRSATVDLTGNSSNNPINLMDDEAPSGVVARTTSSNSSSNANRSATVIDLASEDSVLTSTTTSSSSSSSSALAPVDLTVLGSSGDMSLADRARIYELMEDELDELDDDYAEGQSDEEDGDEDEEEEECQWEEACQCPNCRPLQRLLDRNTSLSSSALNSGGGSRLLLSSFSSSGAVNGRGFVPANRVNSATSTISKSVATGRSSSSNNSSSSIVRGTVSAPIRASLVRAATAPLSRTSSGRPRPIRGAAVTSSNSSAIETTPSTAQVAPLNSGGRLTRTQSLQNNK